MKNPLLTIGAVANLDGHELAPTPSALPSMLFVGYFADRKGLKDSIRVFQKVRMSVPDAELHLVGESTEASPGIVLMDD